MRNFLFYFFILTSFSCGKDKTAHTKRIIEEQKPDTLKSLIISTEKLNVLIAYEEGAEPFVGDVTEDREVWDIAKTNLEKIYETRNKEVEISVPTKIEEMTKVEASGHLLWTADLIIKQSTKIFGENKQGKETDIQILFLNGHFEGKEEIIAVNITETLTIAVFKDVLNEMGERESLITKKLIEQITIVHELGHAFGLVDAGVDLTSEHHDEDHPHHCTQTNCVMYYANEGKKDIFEYIASHALAEDGSLFGSQCLKDLKAYK